MLSSRLVKVFRKMLPVLIIIVILLLLGAALLTNPIRVRSLVIETVADPERLEADVKALTGLPGFRCFEDMVHFFTGDLGVDGLFTDFPDRVFRYLLGA